MQSKENCVVQESVNRYNAIKIFISAQEHGIHEKTNLSKLYNYRLDFKWIEKLLVAFSCDLLLFMYFRWFYRVLYKNTHRYFGRIIQFWIIKAKGNKNQVINHFDSFAILIISCIMVYLLYSLKQWKTY